LVITGLFIFSLFSLGHFPSYLDYDSPYIQSASLEQTFSKLFLTRENPPIQREGGQGVFRS
jgi:hypothetical protein